MTELSDLDVVDAISTDELYQRMCELGAPRSRRRLVARWVLDPESGRPVCLWSADD